MKNGVKRKHFEIIISTSRAIKPTGALLQSSSSETSQIRTTQNHLFYFNSFLKTTSGPQFKPSMDLETGVIFQLKGQNEKCPSSIYFVDVAVQMKAIITMFEQLSGNKLVSTICLTVTLNTLVCAAMHVSLQPVSGKGSTGSREVALILLPQRGVNSTQYTDFCKYMLLYVYVPYQLLIGLQVAIKV